MACGMVRSRGYRPLSSSRARLCSRVPSLEVFWLYLLSSAVCGKPPAAEQPGVWLLSVALGTAACHAGAQRRTGFGGPLWVQGQPPGQGCSPALPQPPRPGMEQRYCSESLRRGTPVPTSHAYFFRVKSLKLNSKNRSRHLISKKKW